MEVRDLSLDSIIPYARNPRKNDGAVDKVAASIKEFGWRSPIVVDEEMVILAGHTRYKAAKKLGLTEAPVHIAEGLTEAQKRAYRIADNRVAEEAEWDSDLLKIELDDLGELLESSGFDEDEIEKMMEEAEEEVEAETKFSEELMQAHNYVVLYFDNEMDWLAAQTHFALESVYSKRSNGKPWSKGVGRVINGAEYINQLKK